MSFMTTIATSTTRNCPCAGSSRGTSNGTRRLCTSCTNGALSVHVQRTSATEPDTRSDSLWRAAVVRKFRNGADDQVWDAGRLDARVCRYVVARLSRIHVVES